MSLRRLRWAQAGAVALLALGGWALLAAPSSASSSLTLPFNGHGRHTLVGPGVYDVTIQFPHRDRTLILDVPSGSDPRTRALVLVYHGALETAAGTIVATDFEQAAARAGYVVAFLQGYADTWNEGAGHTPAEQAGIDDVAFTRAAIAQLSRVVAFDHSRVVASGFSNGALMVQDLGCRLSAMIVAIVPVEGEIPTSVASTCHPSRPVTLYEVHATGDPAIPYGGGPFAGVGGGTTVDSATATAALWASLDGCAATPSQTTTPSRALTAYAGCRAGRRVTLESVAGATHEWAPDIGEIVARVIATLSG